MTSVEVLAARAVIVGLPDDVMPEGYSRGLGIQLDDVATKLAARERAAADALAAAEKASEEAAALAAYGGTAAAEAGWNALRQHNPKVDRSTGERDINSFDELPHALKLNYAAFAFGVLNPGAKLSKARRFETFRDVPEGLRVVDRQGDVVWWSGGDLLCARFDKPVNRGPNSVFAWADQFAPFVEDDTAVEAEPVAERDAEPYQFNMGDRVQIERPDAPNIWVSPDLLDVATVRVDRTFTTDVVDGNGLEQTVPSGWLKLVREPREWDSLAYVPHTVTVTDRTGDTLEFRHGEWWTAPNNSNVWGETGKSFRSLAGGFSISDLDEFAPYTEVIA